MTRPKVNEYKNVHNVTDIIFKNVNIIITPNNVSFHIEVLKQMHLIGLDMLINLFSRSENI